MDPFNEEKDRRFIEGVEAGLDRRREIQERRIRKLAEVDPEAAKTWSQEGLRRRIIHTPRMTPAEEKVHRARMALEAEEDRKRRRILYRLRNWWQNWRTRKVRTRDGKKAYELQRDKFAKLVSGKKEK